MIVSKASPLLAWSNVGPRLMSRSCSRYLVHFFTTVVIFLLRYESETTVARCSLRTLVIDDSATMIDAVTPIMVARGWTVAGFRNARSAIVRATSAKLEGKPFTFTLLDVGEGCPITIARLRSAGVHRVVLYSGRDADEIATYARAWRADDWCTKHEPAILAMLDRAES